MFQFCYSAMTLDEALARICLRKWAVCLWWEMSPEPERHLVEKSFGE